MPNGLLSDHAKWMSESHSLEQVEGKLHTLEYFVSKAAELNDMMEPEKGPVTVLRARRAFDSQVIAIHILNFHDFFDVLLVHHDILLTLAVINLPKKMRQVQHDFQD